MYESAESVDISARIISMLDIDGFAFVQSVVPFLVLVSVPKRR